MKRRTILNAAAFHEIQLQESGYVPKLATANYQGTDSLIWGNYALFMIQQVRIYIYSGHRDKAMRWLSCVQGIMLAIGIVSITDSKMQLKPK